MLRNQLELFSFKIEDDTFMNESIYCLEIPTAWKNYIESKKTSVYSFKLTIKPINLGKKLQALFSPIFSVSWDKKRPWLMADEEVDVVLLKTICLHWFAMEENCLVADLPMEMQEADISWEHATMKEYLENQDDGGVKFDWVPAIMARKFAAEPRFIEIPEGYKGALNLSHIYFNGTHECVSKPIKRDAKSEAFSYVFQFELKNRGGLPEKAIVNVSVGIRRYLQRELKSTQSISTKYNGSILLSMKNPFFSNKNQTQSFIQLKLRKNRNGEIEWAKGADKLFADIIGEELKPFKMLKNPISYMENEELTAYVVYGDLVYQNLASSMKVKKGIGLPEKSALFDFVKESFSQLKPLEHYKELNYQNRMNSDFLPFRHSLNAETSIVFEVWGEEALKDELIEKLVAEEILIGIDDKGTFELNASPSLNIEFIRKDPEGIVEALNVEKYSGKSFERHVRKIEKHLNSVTDDNKVILSLVEIDHKDLWAKNTDPKQAIRNGMANCNRLTQFIYPPDPIIDTKESTRKSRVLSSFYDLITDFGLLPSRVDKIQNEETVIAVDVMKVKKGWKNYYLPVITKYANLSLSIKLFGQTEWLSLKEAQLAVAKQSAIVINRGREGTLQFESFFHRTLHQLLEETDENFIVIVGANLRNNGWLPIQNPKLNLGKIPLNIKHQDAKERLKVVRINRTTDVPQYRINKKGEVGVNRNRGLFNNDSGIYYSIGARPDSMQEPLGVQKFSRPSQMILQQRAIEIIPLGTENQDERDNLAELTHNLRHLNTAYKVHTNLPYPLHMLRSIKKYLFEFDEEVTFYDGTEFDDTVIVEEAYVAGNQ